jgi:hypothetical protein
MVHVVEGNIEIFHPEKIIVNRGVSYLYNVNM